MGTIMPLKWIEQAEAREVCVIAVSEAMPYLPLPAHRLLPSGLLLRVRSWLARSERRLNEQRSLDHVVPLRKVGRQTLGS